MWQTVKNAFIRFTVDLEGRCLWPYLDVKGLVTTGDGNLIDSPQAMIEFNRWYHKSGAPATDVEIASEWNTVKALQSHSNDHPNFWRDRALLTMNADETDAKVLVKLVQFETSMMQIKQLHSYCNMTADAQMGLLSMVWAMGVGNMASYHKFLAFADKLDYAGMASECYMDATHNPGLVDRNYYNKKMFTNAAKVIELGLDITIWYGPFSEPLPTPHIISIS